MCSPARTNRNFKLMHYRVYREAVALVVTQDAVNKAWDTARGGNVAVRASQKELERGL